MTIWGNVVGGGSGFGKTVIIEDADGNEFIGVVVGQEVMLTATADDIKLGKVAVTDAGVVVGTHVCE